MAKLIFMPPISEPAANKYTKVDPCIKSVALINWTFGLLRKAIGLKLGKKDTGPAAAGRIPEQVDADAAIGIPRDEMDYHRQVGNIKVNRAHTFLAHGYSKYLTLVWLVVVTELLMIVHYQLFRNGKYYSHRDHTVDISIHDLVGQTHKNPVAHALGGLASMLMDPLGGGRQYLRILLLKLGDNMDEWPLRVTLALHILSLIHI